MKQNIFLLVLMICLSQYVMGQDTMLLKNPVNIIRGSLPVIAYKWSDTAVNYKVIFTGSIGIGADDLRTVDGGLQVNVIMSNGLVVPLKSTGSGVLLNSGSPSLRIFRRNISGESQYVTDLRCFVEVIYYRKPMNTNATGLEVTRYQNYQPDQWDFVDIKLSGKIIYTDPVTGNVREIANTEVLNRRVNKKMTYGIWATSEPAAHVEPPEEIRGVPGRIAAKVLTGPDGMKRDPADAAVLVQISGGVLRYNLGRLVGLDPYSFQNYDDFAKIEGSNLWRGIGIAGLVYKYGDHGLFERDDWDVKAFMVDFYPDFLRTKNIFFRKHSHYLLNLTANLVRMNGDGDGMKKWAPYF